jgi:hypothetical protein
MERAVERTSRPVVVVIVVIVVERAETLCGPARTGDLDTTG